MDFLPVILQRVRAHGFRVFERGELNLNLVGERSPSNVPGALDDLFHAVWRENGTWVRKTWPCTLDPGRRTFLQLPNPAGAPMIEAPQQASRAYQLGEHKGRPALRQVAPIAIRRDRNRDGRIDRDGPITRGLYGMHIHDGATAEWSAGCTVLPPPAMAELYALCQRSAVLYGDRFTFTVLPA
ncbi:MAG TPA: hypothetical protein VEB22_15355 [Phycisphaerales bacterium]|nr:hypothetical protein [Phycisphaerales bacterium]